jgi:D-3-phosphoglycerate dehydrogenase
MRIVAHDPFISREIASASGAELLSIDDLCAAADFISLHLPSTGETRHLFDDARFDRCRPGVRIVNTARGELIDPEALGRAIDRGIVAGAGLDVFETEPPADWSLVERPQVVATPHIAASTGEAQELVGLETAATVREFLRDGVVRNAVNFPAIRPDDLRRLQPWMRLAEALAAFVSRHARGRITGVSLRYYGTLAESAGTDIVAASAVAALLRPVVAGGASVVNARSLARERGIDVLESRSARPRDYTALLSVRLQTDEGETTVEGTVFEPGALRLVSLNGVGVEAPLSGMLLVLANDDQPGVIGAVGTILGRRGVNIANFALGRGSAGAVAVVNVDDPADARLDEALDEIRRMPAIRDAWIVHV